MRADADRIGQDLEIPTQPSGESPSERLDFRAPMLFVPRRFQVELEQPRPAVGTLEPPARRAVQISEFNPHLLRREAPVRQLLDRPGFRNGREQAAQGQERPPAVHAAVPVEAAEEDRVQDTRRQRVRIGGQHMIELVRIFPGHMTKSDLRQLRCKRRIESRHKWNPAMYRIRMLAMNRGIAVATCIRITAYWLFSSSSAAGTMLKLAAIGVISVPQKPVSIPTAPITAGLPPSA